MLAINQTLQGRYRIIRQLGYGGMGAVYEAIDERFGEPIALKEIIADFTDEKHKDSIIKAFEREAKALAKAKHEAVPYVRDYFSELNRQFLVMELIEGDDLAEMLRIRNNPFPIKDILNWVEQLLDALDYLHTLKPQIIHRDIKPQNLKITARGKIKLLDFGIARSGEKSATFTNQTFVGATLNYSPIEQILRVIDPTFHKFIILKHKEKAEEILKQDTDDRCDIYSLGGTFYHLLTNCIPINATERMLEVWEGKSDPLPPPSKLNPNIPQPISDLLLKAMAIERDHRFSSAIEMRKGLDQAIGGKKPRRKNAKKVLNLFEQENLVINEKKTLEDLALQADTKKVIPTGKIYSDRQTAPTEFLKMPTVETPKMFDNMPVIQVDISALGNFPEVKLDRNNELEIGKENAPKVQLVVEKPVQGYFQNGISLMRVTIAFFSLLLIGGISWIIMIPYFYLSSPSLPTNGKPPVFQSNANRAIYSTPTPAPQANPPTPSPTQPQKTDLAKQRVKEEKNNAKGKPIPSATMQGTPPRVAATRMPVNADCIFNGKCK